MEEKKVLESGGGDCPKPHFALHLGHFWAPPGYPSAQTRLQLQGGEQSRGGSFLIFFCRLGNERHVSAVHQVGGTLEGRERCWVWGGGGHRSSPGPADPCPTFSQSPPHPWSGAGNEGPFHGGCSRGSERERFLPKVTHRGS